MTRYALVGLSFAAALFTAASFAQTAPNLPPAPQPQMQRLPPVAPLPQPQLSLPNQADPLIPVFVVWREGYPSAGAPAGHHGRELTSAADRDRDGSLGMMDCDDDDPRRAPGIPEVVDQEGRDEDCDPFTIGVRDIDLDGHTTWRATQLIRDASGVAIAVLRGPDCDDTRADVSPNAPEVLGDLRDNNCDGLVDVIERTGHGEYCALTREVRRSQAAHSPCGPE